MAFLFRGDYIKRATLLLVLTLLLFSSITLATGEDSIAISDDFLDINFGEIRQLEVQIGEPVIMYQELTVTNTKNRTVNTTIGLRNYPELIPEVYLNEYLSLSITSEGKVYSVQPLLPVILGAYDSKQYILEYEFVPVYKNVDCVEKTIQDLLPKDALILPSSLPPETVVEKTCNVKIHHDGDIHYYNVEVTLEELDGEKINSIYYVEGDSYLELEDGVIRLIQ